MKSNMADEKGCSRRRFLKTAGVAAAGLPFLSAHRYRRVWGANDRLRIGLIGCGGIAQAHLGALLGMQEEANIEIVAVCDVYERRARRFQDWAWQEGARPDVTTDHERVLERSDIDYIVVATPEHWHAQLTLDALDAGHHVYCEKPLTHTVEESFAVVDKARSTGRKLQVGVQGMSDDSYSSAHEAIRAGKLGPVIEAQIDYVRNHPDDQGPWRTRVDDNLPKPADLNWQRWLGPAPERPWSAPRFYEWRNYRDYSGGIASDLFIHRLTRLLKACGLTYPEHAVGMGGIYLWDDGRELPDNMEMLLEYPAHEGITPGMTVHVLGTMGNDQGIDHLIRGQDATLHFTSDGWEIIEQGSGTVIERHQKTGGEDIALHHQNLHDAIRSDAPLHCPPELGLYGVVGITGANQSWVQEEMLTWDEGRRQWT